MLSVAHNLTSMNTARQYGIVSGYSAKSTEKLSSGYKINRAADDAAGLAISEKMRRQVRGLTQASLNCQDGISLCQVRDGALAEVHDILNRMNELSVKSANGTLTAEDRGFIQTEMDHLVSEINRIGSDTTFNHIQVFDYANQMGLEPSYGSSAIGSGYLTDSFQDGSRYFPSANLSFVGIDENTISQLYDKSFRFSCSQSCAEAFKFTFKGDETPSSVSNQDGYVEHQYTINISGETTAKGVLDKLFDFVYNNMPTGTGCSATNTNDMYVSHSNRLVRTSDTAFAIVASSPSFPSANEAEAYFADRKGTDNKYAKADCTEISDFVETSDRKITLRIQAGAEAGQFIHVSMDTMNAKVLGLEPTDVTTQENAGTAINKVKSAQQEISRQRSNAGAEQNRLEHAIKNLDNVVENTQAAESAIRDTDMAREMVRLANLNILSQAGTSMMAQANQSNQTVLSLLQG